MRLIDVVFRGGHLSEQKLIETVMSGERPAHVERCDICAERAVELGRWLDQVRVTGNEAVDTAFPPERLMAQQQQILRRLEQLDQPARVISFPNQARLTREMNGRRVAVGWLGVAAAAGIVLGLLGGQVVGRFRSPAQPVVTATAAQSHEALSPAGATLLDENLERVRTPALDAIDQMTPTLVLAKAGG